MRSERDKGLYRYGKGNDGRGRHEKHGYKVKGPNSLKKVRASVLSVRSPLKLASALYV